MLTTTGSWDAGSKRRRVENLMCRAATRRKMKHICTPHLERANLSTRTRLHRFTRLSLGCSKTLEHLTATIHLYMAFFNFCRVHQSLLLRATPAMQAGIADHVGFVQECLTWTGK